MNAMKLANAIGCTHATIFDLFSFKRDDVKAEELVSMAAAMGYEVVLRGHGEEIRIDPACRVNLTKRSRKHILLPYTVDF